MLKDDQVISFSSYQTHAGSLPSYQQCMMLSHIPPNYAVRTQNSEKLMKRPSSAQIDEEEDNSRTCQEAIALFLLLYFLMIIFCWIAVLLDGSLV